MLNKVRTYCKINKIGMITRKSEIFEGYVLKFRKNNYAIEIAVPKDHIQNEEFENYVINTIEGKFDLC